MSDTRLFAHTLYAAVEMPIVTVDSDKQQCIDMVAMGRTTGPMWTMGTTAARW